MKNILLILSAIVMFHFPSPAQAKPEDKSAKAETSDFCSAESAKELFLDTDPKTASGNLFSVICEWGNAVRDRDTRALEKLFDDDLFVTSHDGSTRTKKEELEAIQRGADVKTKSRTTERLRIREIENTAVVAALTNMHFLINGKDVHEAYRYTAVFVKYDGKWKLRALQTAKIN